MKCIECGKEFVPKQKYCSSKCRTYAFRNGSVTEPHNDNVTVTKPAEKIPKVFSGGWNPAPKPGRKK
jgi:hypothetical protein